MKKFLLAVTSSLACLTAFGQGHVSFQTDSLHLVYWDPGWGSSFGGAPMSPENGPFGFEPIADRYMGTSSSLLWLYTSATFNPNLPGRWNAVNLQANANLTTGAPAIAGGTRVFVLIQVRDASLAPYDLWTPEAPPLSLAGWGLSQEFQFTLGATPAYPVLIPGNFGNSTWSAGTFNMDSYVFGSRGAIALPAPEPSVFGFVGIAGLALLLLCPRQCARACFFPRLLHRFRPR